MKRAVICTNQARGGTPIFRGAARRGEITYDPEPYQMRKSKRRHYFLVDFTNQIVTVNWGGHTPMTPKEAARFGADFGLWFES